MSILVGKWLGVLFCTGLMMSLPSCTSDSYLVDLSGPATISDQWIQLTPKSSLKADQDSQMIVLDLESPFKYDFYKEGKGPNAGKGILMPDGEVINPEVEVIDQYGNSFKLIWRGARKTFQPVYNLPFPDKFPRDREYKTVRIRSPRPIKVKTVYWLCESNNDSK
ncbi:MAG: hypothetical protein QOH71_3796 [Blastocatellia bacterium]|nr:hypothetical protein [Blastocatellia bacterium]